VPIKMRALNLGIRKINRNEPKSPFTFKEKEIDLFARIEHNRWIAEYILKNYKLNKTLQTTDHINKETPHLIQYEDLSNKVKDLDRLAVYQIPKFLNNIGLELYRH